MFLISDEIACRLVGNGEEVFIRDLICRIILYLSLFQVIFKDICIISSRSPSCHQFSVPESTKWFDRSESQAPALRTSSGIINTRKHGGSEIHLVSSLRLVIGDTYSVEPLRKS
jgi:hypothetical protein